MIGLYVCLILSLNIPYVQRKFSAFVAHELGERLDTRVAIGRIDVGLPGRVVIDDLSVDDRQGETLLHVARLSAKVELTPLFLGRISIGNVQLFGFNARLEREDRESEANYQFIIDALSPRQREKKSNLRLRINSLLIRRGSITYDVATAKETPGRFNKEHVRLENLLATLSLKALSNDSINLSVKRMSLDETGGGFNLKRLSMKLTGGQRLMQIADFGIELPGTRLRMDTIRASYDSLANIGNSRGKLHFAFHMPDSPITLSDLSAFVPVLGSFNDELTLSLTAEGNLDRLECDNILLYTRQGYVFKAHGEIRDWTAGRDPYISAQVDRMTASRDGVAFLVRNMSRNYDGVPLALRNMGNLSFEGRLSGRLSELTAYGVVNTEVGEVRTDLLMSSNRERGLLSYRGALSTTDFQVGRMLSNDKLGRVSMNVDVEGRHSEGRWPDVKVVGEVSQVDYSGYTYENITLDGTYRDGGFVGRVSLDDENGTVEVDGRINAVSRPPSYVFRATAQGLRPGDLKIADDYPDSELSMSVTADFTGGNLDEMIGSLRIDSLHLHTADEELQLDNFTVSALKQDSGKRLTVSSDFMDADIEGEYSYRTLSASFSRLLGAYLPSLSPPDRRAGETRNNFSFNVHIRNTDLLAVATGVPIRVYSPSTLTGYFNEDTHRLRIEGYFPRLQYGKRFIEGGMITCDNQGDELHGRVRLTNRLRKGGSVSLALETRAGDNRVDATLNWGNAGVNTYSGRIATAIHFEEEEPTETDNNPQTTKRGKRQPYTTIVDILPTQVMLNDTLWELHASQATIASGRVHINDFAFTHGNRHLHVDGVMSALEEDTLHIDLNAINIGYVFDIADVGVNFQGEATGPAYAAHVFHQPFMATDLRILRFSLNDRPLGDADIRGEWHHDVQGIYLDADIREGEVARTQARGYVYPLKPKSGVDLYFDAQNTSVDFIHYYITHITRDFGGRVTGPVRLYGLFRALNLSGQVYADAHMGVAAIGTTYTLRDSIYFSPEGISFRQSHIYDRYGNEATMDGEVSYTNFRRAAYNLRFNMPNRMLVMDTRETPDFSFYGTVYGQGTVDLSGNYTDGTDIDIALTTLRGTRFTYIKDYVTTALSNQFITFVDRTPRRAVLDSIADTSYDLARRRAAKVESEEPNVRLNLIIDATTDADMGIVMDPTTGDNIRCRGEGNLRADFYTKGDLRMFGSYRISSGQYKLSIQEIIRKDFTIRDGGTITFNGNPFEATLDISAGYTVTSASLNDLMANAANYVDQTNVKVECIMNLSGSLTNPQLKFSLELPNERDEVLALVKNYVPTDEQMNMQILYLLSIGKFYTPENAGSVQNSNMAASMLSSTLSGQLNDALSNIINSSDWRFGTYVSTGQEGWTDMEFETMLSGQLLNNRLLINGNFGYRDNALSNTNFVGDFEAEWLVTPRGDIRLRAYNETNDRYYTKTNLTTQGIGIIFRRDFDRWSELIFWSKWKLKRVKNQ